MPDDLRGLRCGALNRRGDPCKRSDIYRNGRCKYHGGLSTGPKTAEGRGRARVNLGLRWSSEPHAGLKEPDAAGAGC
ncbi:HGGxSTG domain-containing protein [Sphingomonas sp. Leaf37]|uniref:HGGxSTG domain-containing protein n=1 Tax=Sphingomonas sp. Leaf37 TaxID=2876552 RepID=UPI003FA76DF7